MVQCVAVGDTGMQTGMEAPGRTIGFELFDEIEPEEVANTAADRALAMLRARPAPSGKLPVVLKRGAGGVLFHEACGHGLEADLVARDASVFRGQRGEQVASPLVTLVDDGTFAREWGAYAIDDEGATAQRNVLIEDGVLTDYMWDLVRARKEGRASSGNGRRETYQHLPMVRMTNTYLLEGDEDPDDIISRTANGLYCVALGGGQVNTATGDFVFGVTEAYLIENGEITDPVRAAQLIGNGPEVLRRVDAVGSDFDTWAGTCGKDGQGVPVSSGQPTLRVSELTVGGTAHERPVGRCRRPARRRPRDRGPGPGRRAGRGVCRALARHGRQGVRRRRRVAVGRRGRRRRRARPRRRAAGVRVGGFARARGRRRHAGRGARQRRVRRTRRVRRPSPPLTTPLRSRRRELDLWRDDLLAVPTDDKVALALEVERATRAGDPRVRGVESASYGDAAIEAAVANSLGVEAVARRTVSSCASLRARG